MKKTILYSRVSTSEQAEFGYSLSYQNRRLKEYCKINKISNYEIYSDPGFSGKNINRPMIQKIISEISLRGVHKLIFLKIDRLSRNIDDYRFISNICNTNGVKMISLNENIEDTAIGEFSQNILIALAEMERKQISERTITGFISMLQQGKYPWGGKLPLGISKDNDKKLFYNDDIEKVLYIFNLHKKGTTYQEIRRRFEKKYKCETYKNYIENIIKNDIYKGYIYYNDTKYNVINEIKI